MSWPRGPHLLVHVDVGPGNKWEKSDYNGNTQLDSSASWTPVSIPKTIANESPIKF
jgi:hypothetical protein